MSAMVRLLNKTGYIGAKTDRLSVVEWHGKEGKVHPRTEHEGPEGE